MAFNEKYVDAAAAGGGTGTSAADPWTWDEAVANYAAGDRVNVKAGTYSSSGTTSTVSGSIADPIVFRGYKTTIGDLDGVALNGLVDGVDMPTISTTADNSGIRGSYLNVNNISFTTSQSYRAYAWAFGAYGAVSNCRFISTSTLSSCPCRGASFFGCYFEGRTNYGACQSGYLFDSCVFRAPSGSINAIGLTTTTGTVTNSIFVGFDLLAINWLYQTHSMISACTFVDCGVAIQIGVNNHYNNGSKIISNNYFANCTTAVNDTYRTEDPTFFLMSNGFYNVTNQTSSGLTFNYSPKVDISDPFVDSANGDYRLTSSSLGYGSSQQKVLDQLNTVNNRDLGALQHADPAYVAPPDASATTKIFPFRSWVEGDFQQEGADADEFVEKHELQALPVFEFSIGSGADRDYNSLSAFVAAFDNTLINIPNSKVIVTCYNDTGADQAVIETTTNRYINPPSNCRELVVTVDDDSWHKGDFGKGCVIRASGGYTNLLSISNTSSKKIVLERLVIDGDAQSLTNSAQNLISTSNAPGLELKDLLIQGSDGTSYGPSSYGATGINVAGSQLVYINNCVVRNIIASRAGNYRAYGMNIANSSSVNNCTVYNITAPNSAYTTKSMGIASNTGTQVNNSVVMQAVDGLALNGGIIANTVTDDATGTYQSTPAGEFVDAANGDFKLKGTASAAGIVAATNAKVTDITGKLRKAGVAQDAGAFNNVAGYDDSPVFPPDQPTDPIIHPLRGN